MTTPRIYVACLAAYNAGWLHGEWIEANQDVDAVWAEVQAMLAASPVPGAEEWAIHDFEGFGPLRLGEYESLERVVATASGIAEHGVVFAAWMDADESRDPTDVSAFVDAYRGEWPSLRAYAEEWAESTGLDDIAERCGSPYIRVDIDSMERDMEIEMHVVDTPDHTVWVFDPNV